MNLTNTQIETKLIQHDLRFERIEKKMETDRSQIMNAIQISHDQIMAILLPMRDEIAVMNFAITRLETGVHELKENVCLLKDDVSALKTDMVKVKNKLELN